MRFTHKPIVSRYIRTVVRQNPEHGFFDVGAAIALVYLDSKEITVLRNQDRIRDGVRSVGRHRPGIIITIFPIDLYRPVLDGLVCIYGLGPCQVVIEKRNENLFAWLVEINPAIRFDAFEQRPCLAFDFQFDKGVGIPINVGQLH